MSQTTHKTGLGLVSIIKLQFYFYTFSKVRVPFVTEHAEELIYSFKLEGPFKVLKTFQIFKSFKASLSPSYGI